jgi:uncharacterized membrane protein
MDPDKNENIIIRKAIQKWKDKGIIDAATAEKMTAGYEDPESNSLVLSTYALIASVSCGLLAFGALVMDEKWIELIRRRFGFSEVFVGFGFVLLSALFVYFSKRRQVKMPQERAANEAYNIIIALSLAVAIAYIGRSIGYQNGNYAPVLFLAASLYAATALYLRSTLLWVTSIVGLIGWWAAQTYYWSNGADYFLGMNYAMRMTLFSLVLLLLQVLTTYIKGLQVFAGITKIISWISFLITAWTLSILGNSSNIEAWFDIRQGRLWYWAVGFTVLLIGLVLYAFRKKDPFLRDATLVFFLINIYTRYFEYFWDKTNKGLFFAILAFSFWWIGKAAEKWMKRTG